MFSSVRLASHSRKVERETAYGEKLEVDKTNLGNMTVALEMIGSVLVVYSFSHKTKVFFF
jgi:ribosomal protein S19